MKNQALFKEMVRDIQAVAEKKEILDIDGA